MLITKYIIHVVTLLQHKISIQKLKKVVQH